MRKGIFLGFIGNALVFLMIKKFQKQSLVIFIVSFSTVLSAVAMTVVQFFDVIESLKNSSKNPFFSPVCH